MKTADELIASVDATLDGWRLAIDSSLPHGKDTVAIEAAAPADKKKTYLWEDSDKYLERLSTFQPDTYFAKPLSISPLVCAAFGWENTGRDIIRCAHNQCKATLCVKFHPALDKSSKSNLCAKYLTLLASSHKDLCPFQSFAKRSLKVMERNNRKNNTDVLDVEEANSSKPAELMGRVTMALESSALDLYVPTYMLPLCNELKRFEDFTGDGSVTMESVEEGAFKIQSQINANGAVGVEIPDLVSTYCREVLSDPDTELFDKNENCSRDAFLLSAFGWSLCDENGTARNMMGVMLKCNLCLSKAILASAAPVNIVESPKKKRRRIDTLRNANIKLLDSHRAYCPYVSGFANGVCDRSEPGWKVVLSNLKK